MYVCVQYHLFFSLVFFIRKGNWDWFMSSDWSVTERRNQSQKDNWNRKRKGTFVTAFLIFYQTAKSFSLKLIKNYSSLDFITAYRHGVFGRLFAPAQKREPEWHSGLWPLAVRPQRPPLLPAGPVHGLCPNLRRKIHQECGAKKRISVKVSLNFGVKR